jgi:hypothetical protein
MFADESEDSSLAKQFLKFLDAPTTLDMPNNGVTEVGQYALAALLMGWGNTIEGLRSLEGFRLWHLTDKWVWHWTVTGKGEYVGTLPKRLAKFIYKRYAVKLAPSQLAQVGELLANNIPKSKSVVFRVRNTIDWRAGAFHDDGSCYWGCRSAARSVVEENGYAICFYNPDEPIRHPGSGIARCWAGLRPDDTLVIFNAYGMLLQDVAHIISFVLGAYYKRCILCNNGANDGLLWINGATGFILGRQDQFTTSTPHIDLEWGMSADCNICDRCGQSVWGDLSAVGGSMWCDECADEYSTSCDHCGEIYETDGLCYVHGKYYCDECLDREFTRCEHCGEYALNDDTTDVDGDSYCEGCLQRLCVECEECCEWVCRNDGPLCSHCREAMEKAQVEEGENANNGA